MSFAFWLNCKLSSKHILGCCSVLFMTHTNRIFLKTNNYTKESALDGGSLDFSGFYSVSISSSGWFHLGSLMFQQCYCRCYGVFDMLRQGNLWLILQSLTRDFFNCFVNFCGCGSYGHCLSWECYNVKKYFAIISDCFCFLMYVRLSIF